LNNEPAYEKLIEAATDFADFLNHENLDGAFVGAFAIGFWIQSRSTRDVDAMVFWGERDPAELAELAEKYGFTLRSEDSMAIAKRSRILLLIHQESRVTVDVSLGLLPFEAGMAERAVAFESKGVTFRIASAEDLFIMKVLANRDQDRRDLAELVRFNPNLNQRYIMLHVIEMAEALELPEMIEQAERFLSGNEP